MMKIYMDQMMRNSLIIKLDLRYVDENFPSRHAQFEIQNE